MLLNNHLRKKILVIATLIFCLLIPTVTSANSVADCKDDIANCLEADNDSNKLSNDAKQESDNATSSLIFGFLKTGFALLLILALIYIMVKFLGKKNHSLQQTKILENLGGISLGQNKSIQMVRVGNKILLVGVGENIQLLDEITDESIIEQLLRDEPIEQKGQLVSSLLNRLGYKNSQDDNTHNFKNLFSNELNKLKDNQKKAIKLHKEKEDNYE